ncbi:hypothetical protein CK203_101458 [Vitis vinifera]|uniref:Uncharacterized protein n=1 Tax=Vitis vinifera TaxID=29760 RepID=A0A438BRF0_VITVI|nr:hypothetical protein CK203_101458 [Vitis vinifera]
MASAKSRFGCENGLRCEINFAAQYPPLRKFSQLRKHLLAHECHFAAQELHFAAAKWLRNPQSVKSPIFAAIAQFRRVFAAAKHPFGTRVPFAAHTREDPKTEQPSIFSLSSEPRPRAPPPISAGPPWQEPEELSPPPVKPYEGFIKDPCPRLHIRASATTTHPTSSSGSTEEPSARRASYRASAVSAVLAAAFRFSDPLRMTPEMIIKCPMLTQPPIEAPAQGLLPSAPEVSYGTIAYSKGFLLSRVAMDFYQSMTTHHVRDPTVIHFTIDGRHGASTGQYLQRKELPPSMFFIDALLRHNIFPLQHWVQRRGALLEALYRISEGFFFGPHHLIMAALCILKRRSIRRSCSERCHSSIVPQIVMSDFGTLGLPN